jgi:hypothetical protein
MVGMMETRFEQRSPPPEYYTWDAEAQCNWHLAELYREYTVRAQPFLDALARLAAMRPPERIYFTREQLQQLQQWNKEKTDAEPR